MRQLLFSSQEDGTGLALELQPSYGHYGEVRAQQPFFFDDAQLQALTGQSTSSQQDGGLGLKSMLGYAFRPHQNDLMLTPFSVPRAPQFSTITHIAPSGFGSIGIVL